jgi:hypothetical protein
MLQIPTRHYVGARRSFDDAARQLDDRRSQSLPCFKLFPLVQLGVGSGTRDRRARSRSEHFDERPRSGT